VQYGGAHARSIGDALRTSGHHRGAPSRTVASAAAELALSLADALVRRRHLGLRHRAPQQLGPVVAY
jgi:hypothetical protein